MQTFAGLFLSEVVLRAVPGKLMVNMAKLDQTVINHFFHFLKLVCHVI